MKNSKLFKVLTKLSIYQRNRLQKFLRSPYFNKRKELCAIFEYINEQIKQDKTSINKTDVWEYTFNNQDFNDAKFRKYCNNIIRLIQDFLALEQYQQNPLQQANNLLGAIHKNNLRVLSATSLKTARRLSERSLHRSSKYYYEQYVLEGHFYYLTQYEVQRRKKSNIQEIIKNLDYFYLAAKLRNHCNLLIRQHYTAYEYETLFIDEIIQHIEDVGYEDVPAISIYYNVYKLITTNKNRAYFEKIKQQINQSIELFSDSESKDLYYFLLNFCVNKVNTGNQKYYQDLFDIYESGIDKEILLVDGTLTEWDFKNVVVVALRLQKYSWVENFIHTKAALLDPNIRDNAVRFNQARLHFYRKDFDKVIWLLREVEFSDMSYNLSSKAMLLATYYETDEIEALLSFMKSFKTFLIRSKKKLPQHKIDIYLNEIKYIKRLLSIKPGNQDEIKKFEEDLAKEKNIADIRWLKEKIKELE